MCDRSALGQPHGTCKGLAGPVNCRADSPIKYSNVRSSKERLGSMQGPLNAADYNTDTAGKQFIATGLEGTAARFVHSAARLLCLRFAVLRCRNLRSV